MASDDTNEDNWLYGDDETAETCVHERLDAAENAERETEDAIEDEPPQDEIANSESANLATDSEDQIGAAPDEELDLPPGIEPDEDQNTAVEDEDLANNEDDKENDEKGNEMADDGNGSETGQPPDTDEEESDDDVNVVIGDIKTSPTYTSLNIKRGLITAAAAVDKLKQQQGKFSIDEFETIGTINGLNAQEYNLDSLEDKPWRKPGADITDYFNYGFNEDTWRAYCERQKRMRVHESGVGLAPMNSIGLPRAPTSITNDNSKYSGNFTGPRKAGPPPGRRMTGSIDVIGGNSGLASRRGIGGVDTTPTPQQQQSQQQQQLKVISAPGSVAMNPKENVIQVMTADRREYSRKPPGGGGFPDMSVPPPIGGGVPGGPGGPPGDMSMPPPGFDGYGGGGEFFNPEPEMYYGGYEPTQDSQWNAAADAHWAPSEIKQLTPGPTVIPTMPQPNMGPPTMVPPPPSSSTNIYSTAPGGQTSDPPSDDYLRGGIDDASPARESSRSRSEKPDRLPSSHRERSHRRDRSRSRSRRHKSRSRSPGAHRSHRKKKSRRHEKDESD